MPSATACEPTNSPPLKRRLEVTAGALRTGGRPRSRRPQGDLSPKKSPDLSPKKYLEAGQQLFDGGGGGGGGGGALPGGGPVRPPPPRLPPPPRAPRPPPPPPPP